MAHVDYFLKIDGIEGEAPDAKHKNEIHLDSFHWGESNSASMATGCRGGAGEGGGARPRRTAPGGTERPRSDEAVPGVQWASCDRLRRVSERRASLERRLPRMFAQPAARMDLLPVLRARYGSTQ